MATSKPVKWWRYEACAKCGVPVGQQCRSKWSGEHGKTLYRVRPCPGRCVVPLVKEHVSPISKLVQHCMAERGIDSVQLAKLMFLQPGTVRHLLAEDRNPLTEKSARILLKVMGYTLRLEAIDDKGKNVKH